MRESFRLKQYLLIFVHKKVIVGNILKNVAIWFDSRRYISLYNQWPSSRSSLNFFGQRFAKMLPRDRRPRATF